MFNYINKLLVSLISLPRKFKQIIMILVDSVFVVLSLLLSFSIRLDRWYVPGDDLIWVIYASPILAIPIFIKFGLYQAVIRFMGLRSIWEIVQAFTLFTLVWGISGFMAAIEGIPRSVILINIIIGIFLLTGIRLFCRWIFDFAEIKKKTKELNNVVIFGAGSAGRQLSTVLYQSDDYNPIAFVDDSSDLIHQKINNLLVISKNDLKDLIYKENIKEVLIALPSTNISNRNKIINFLETLPVIVRSLPSLSEIARGNIKIDDLREISVDELLGRDVVEADKDLLSINIFNKVVMVTGAGGSIGSELCRQIISLKPRKLILFERSEIALYSIEKELSLFNKSNIDIYPILGSVNNSTRLSHVFNSFNVNTIYHAAAYKHVPIVEFNNAEGVINNIFGTLRCAQVAIKAKVDTFVLISTDKAVRPTNTMGVSKRFAELILQALSKNKDIDGNNFKTRFSIVRFGNVLNSSGSVIPLFKEQIKNGGPVTVTDSSIIRYFMTIPEAVELVIQAGAMGNGGDVFVLNMGEPIKIIDLAIKMIHLSGLEVRDSNNPNGDIEIKYTGLRPGEKMFEELLIGDKVTSTKNSMIMRAKEKMMVWDELKLIIDELKKAVDNCDQTEIRKLLIKAVPEFKPQTKIADLMYIVNKK
jgi:FlaA1/EpsC-like NDP-sugar epimerase